MTEPEQQSGRSGARTDRSDETTAERIVVSHSAALSDTARRRLEAESFRTYLHRAHDEARAGDVWEEFVGVGCGATRDVSLRVERVDGGTEIGDATEFSYVTRENSGLDDE